MCQINKNFNQTAGQLLIKVTCPMLLGQQTLPWRPLTIAINLTDVASPAQNEPVIGLEDRLFFKRWFEN